MASRRGGRDVGVRRATSARRSLEDQVKRRTYGRDEEEERRGEPRQMVSTTRSTNKHGYDGGGGGLERYPCGAAAGQQVAPSPPPLPPPTRGANGQAQHSRTLAAVCARLFVFFFTPASRPIPVAVPRTRRTRHDSGVCLAERFVGDAAECALALFFVLVVRMLLLRHQPETVCEAHPVREDNHNDGKEKGTRSIMPVSACVHVCGCECITQGEAAVDRRALPTPSQEAARSQSGRTRRWSAGTRAGVPPPSTGEAGGWQS